MFKVKIIDEAQKDLGKLDLNIVLEVFKGIKKVSKNPLPQSEGEYGKPLGNKKGNNLTGFLKIKYLDIAIRVVYTLVRLEEVMNIVVISDRDDNECYDLAADRRKKYGKDLLKDKFEPFGKG